ncbi:GNAT family acetyltransferase [Rhizoctonia solani]|uniref:GNAT family acetyltransferase n=1 Tax=Rhizoctonia solani TaxID=456999 RepID=A0A8H8NWS9_9AGAM|nr:GNAT family acetyltransferase [Rhizoctonia solani]QRW20980.1 GNAT family acetyltransferase [Rhizoctonia solani]
MSESINLLGNYPYNPRYAGAVQHNSKTNEPFIALPAPHSNIHLTPPRLDDADDILPIMNNREIFMNLASAPYPYLREHCDARLRDRVRDYENAMAHIHIREVAPDGTETFLGDIGLVRECEFCEIDDKESRADAVNTDMSLPPGDPRIIIFDQHTKDEVIMSVVIKTVTDVWAIPHMNARRFYAAAFIENVGSQKVFQKNGFDIVSRVYARRPPNYEVDFVGDPRPSNPEEWIIFAQKKLWTTGKVVDVIQALADIEPDLLEFLMSDEEVRGAPQLLALPTIPYINRLPPNLSLVDRAVDEACRQVIPYLTLLSALGQIQFAVAIEHEEAFPTKKSQKRRKASNAMRVRQNTSAVDPRLFTAVGLEHPTTIEELQKIEVQVMQRLQVLLEVLLGAFESAELGAYSETLFFGNPFQQINEQSMVAIVADESTEGSDPLPVTNPGVFPHIRPLAAAKYFDEGSALGAWSIISGRAVNDLRQMRKGDSHVFGMVEKKITELSQGFFSESNQKRLVGLDTEVPIYEAKVSRDIRIVYQIDLDTDVDAKIDKQIIRFTVSTRMPNSITDYGHWSHTTILVVAAKYRRRCLHRETPRAPGQNVTLPAYFPYEDTEVPGDSSPPPPTASVESEMSDKDLLNLHSLIALEKFIPMSRSLIDAILNDSDSNHVFQVSPKEKEIIYHDSACFVLGRSGTGKTTSIVFKMIGIEKLFEQMGEMAKPRQVFVTQSRVLAQRVQEYYQSLQVRIVFKMIGIEKLFEQMGEMAKPRQVFVTQSRVLAQRSSKSDEDEEHVLADLDDEDVSAFGLPAKYSMLEDRHFPLFVTFDQPIGGRFWPAVQAPDPDKAHAAAEKRFALSEVADVKIDLDQDDEAAQDNDNKPASPTVETTERMLEAKQAAVTFEVFVAAYWPHFDYQLKKGLDPALVYSEFLGIIGSEAALSSKYGALVETTLPYSIDKLKKETGITDAQNRSSFLVGSAGSFVSKQFLREKRRLIDFGASQVILVRNEAARNALREQSKGLEFDDVLHTTSLGLGPQRIYLASYSTRFTRSEYWPSSPGSQSLLDLGCSEKAEPMKLFWRKQGLIKECGPNDPMPQLSVSSTDADWAKSGRLLFNKRLYPQAMFCFEKANLLVERDIAAAYESRKQARLLQAAKSVDRTTRRAAFANTASDFLGCAFLSKGKQQTSCYLRAAECYLQAEDWKAAAEAFYSANDFDMAARNFRRAGCFDEAIGVVKKHRSCVKNNVADDIFGVARLEYFRTNKLEKASGLFEEVEDQLEYMEDYGFTGALMHVLEHHKRFDQAAEVAFAERNVTEGVRLLSQSEHPASVRRAVEKALRGLWMMIPFGLTGDKRSNPAILPLIDQLSANTALNNQEAYELKAFQALHANDVNALFELAQSSCSSTLTLLCFSHSSRLLTPHRNSTIAEFIQKAKPAIDYIGQLLRFARSLDVTLHETQKFLGIDPIESAESGGGKSHLPEYWIHSTSPMFEGAQKSLGDATATPSTLGVLSLAVSELHARQLASTVIYDTARMWSRRLYENFMPHFPPLGNVSCVDSRRIPEFIDSTNAISAWCEDALHELDPGSGPPNKFLSDVLAYLDISFRVHRQDYIFKLHTRKLVRPRDDLMVEVAGPIPIKYSIVHDFINFYARKSQDVISRVIRATWHIVWKSLAIEANLLVNILEFIGREIIVHWRFFQKGHDGVFDQLLLPRSWAFDLVRRPPLPLQKGIALHDYLNTLYKTLELLHSHEVIPSPLYGFNGPLNLLVRSALIMRICRLIVLVANNISIPQNAKEGIRRVITGSLTGPGQIHTKLCARFSGARSWRDLWDAVRDSPLNQGVEELVFLSLRRDGYKPPPIKAVRPITYSNLNPELEQLLSLVEISALNPGAKPFIPQAQNIAPTDAEDTIEPTQPTANDSVEANELLEMVIPDGDLPSVSQAEPERTFTLSEIEFGKKILFCFRRHMLCQRILMRNAIKTIWIYYLRHRLRHKMGMTPTEEQIRKIYNEYKKDVDSIDCPLLYAQAFRYHERVLLGCMPHVLVYLRGLERVNQQEKEANKKRLQKVQHEELDRVRIRMDACAKLAKKIKVLLRRIAPGSPALHKIDTLREEVNKVDLLRIEILGIFGESTIPKSLEEQYSLGILTIMSPPRSTTAPKPSRPDLNTSDITM